MKTLKRPIQYNEQWVSPSEMHMNFNKVENDVIGKIRKFQLYQSAQKLKNNVLCDIDLPQKLFKLTNEQIQIESVEFHYVSNAWVSPYGLICTVAGLVNESQYPMFPNWKNVFTFIKKIALNKVKKTNKSCLVCLNPFWNNYYHWLGECMPRIFAAKKFHKNLAIIIPENSPKFVWDYLDFFEFKEIITVKENELVYAPEVCFTSSLPYAIHHPTLMKDMADYILSKCNVSNQESLKKIFISRVNAKYRKSDQEDDIYNTLAHQGYVKHCLEDLTVGEQIALFANAESVVGIHGAGFANIIFAKQCKNIVDFMHIDHNDTAFIGLAAINDIAYKFILCEGKGKLKFKNNDDLVIDIKDIISYGLI